MAAPTGPFLRSDRLLHRREFQRVTRLGRRGVCDGIVLLARISEETRVAPRLGITMSRQVGGSVVRNRLKRQVREWFRRERCGFTPGLELVVIGRREAGSLDPAELRRTLRCAAERAGVVVR